MRKREEGFTLIEILVAIAIMGILITMISPILNITTQSNMKEKVINEIDSSLAKSVELIKRTARSAKTTSAVNRAIQVTTSSAVTMNVPVEVTAETITNETVIFTYNQTARTISVASGTGTTDVIASNVTAAEFRYVDNKVLTIYIKVDLNGKNVPEAKKEKWKIKEIRDAAVTSLDVE